LNIFQIARSWGQLPYTFVDLQILTDSLRGHRFQFLSLHPLSIIQPLHKDAQDTVCTTVQNNVSSFSGCLYISTCSAKNMKIN